MHQNRFLACPRPQTEVLEFLERLTMAAKEGRLRAISVVTVNPSNDVETASVGDLHPPRSMVLIAGHSKAINELLKQ